MQSRWPSPLWVSITRCVLSRMKMWKKRELLSAYLSWDIGCLLPLNWHIHHQLCWLSGLETRTATTPLAVLGLQLADGIMGLLSLHNPVSQISLSSIYIYPSVYHLSISIIYLYLSMSIIYLDLYLSLSIIYLSISYWFHFSRALASTWS